MADVFKFEESLQKGEAGERKIKKLFKNFYYPIAERFLSFEGYKYGFSRNSTKKQLSGIDGKIQASFRFDSKISRYFPDDKKLILLELFHTGVNYPKYKLGWFFILSADVVFWLWEPKKGDLYYFDSGYYLFLKNIRKWLIGNNDICNKFTIRHNNRPSEDKGVQWNTFNMYLSPEDFPENCILKIEKSTFVLPIEESYFYKFFKE